MSHNLIGRRRFLQLMSISAVASTLPATIAKALEIPANSRTRSIRDVEHIVILMQENRPFDHHFGTLRGVRGFSDPRAVNIHLPSQSGRGSTLVPVFLQPAGAANEADGFAVPPDYGTLGGPADGAYVVPPFRVNPGSISPGSKSLGFTYFRGTDHYWNHTHDAWNEGQWDRWPIQREPMAMSYMTRQDIPYHYALADAFTVADAYYSSVLGPTDPNRLYLWTGCIGNVNYLGEGGTNGVGGGPVTYDGLGTDNASFVWETFPEVLQAAGISWKIYQDVAGEPFAPDFGDGTNNAFCGNYTDNPMLFFKQYADSSPGTPLFDNAATGTDIIETIPRLAASDEAWRAWAEGLFSQFQGDVENGTLPQVSWIVAPRGYTEHPDFPVNYGAWYISQVLEILVSRPEIFSKTVLLVNYDEGDGSFDHIPPPTVPPTPAYGASTVSIENEIVSTSNPSGPIGLGTRVPFIAISPWSKGGYVNSQVFDHSSVIQFIEKRFGVFERNISPWRRAVVGDLTSVFNFANPNATPSKLPPADGSLPPRAQLAGAKIRNFIPTLSDVILGVPMQEKGIRPARALPYEIDVQESVNDSNRTVTLTFINSGGATVVFQVRSGDPKDHVRQYTVQPGKQLSGVWNVDSTYNLSVYGPNGFVRYFNGNIGPRAAYLDVRSTYRRALGGAIRLSITNLGSKPAQVTILNAYAGDRSSSFLRFNQTFEEWVSLSLFHGWYDFVVTVAGDPTFKYQLAGHVETGKESFSDPALGGLVELKS